MFKRITLLVTSAAMAIAMPPVLSILPIFANSASISASAWAAQSSLPVPAQLAAMISALDKAANSQDLNAVIKFYAPSFSHSDGLNRTQYQQNLKAFWQRYKNVTYRTEVSKWEQTGDVITADTITTVTGKNAAENDDFSLTATLTSTQTYKVVNGQMQILSQRVLSEQSLLSNGSAPPPVKLKVPDIIGVGRQYVLDAIVTDPLGANLLLGAALEQPVSDQNYITESAVSLAPLQAGGLFKIGQAPFSSGDRWISVVLVGETGTTIAGQRLRVTRDFTGNQYTPLPEPDTTPSRVRPQSNNNQTL